MIKEENPTAAVSTSRIPCATVIRSFVRRCRQHRGTTRMDFETTVVCMKLPLHEMFGGWVTKRECYDLGGCWVNGKWTAPHQA